MNSGPAVFIVGAARTPVAKINGSLSSFSATDLGAAAIKAAVSKSNIPHDLVDHVYMGQALQAGAGQSPAKQAAILAGLSETVESTTVNKVCASGLKAVCLAAQEIMLGHGATILAAGGMESMSNVPLYKAKNRAPGATKPAEDDNFSDGLHDGLVNPYDGLFMGSCADQIAARHGISRNDQDKYAATAYRKACAAQKGGLHDHEITSVVSSLSSQPEHIVTDTVRDKAVFQRLSSLPSAFSDTGTITAGNSSTLADGAAAVVLASYTVAKKYCEETEILARIISFADASEKPLDFAVAPSKAIQLALERANLATDQISLWEINEAFAVVVLVNQEILKLDKSKVNVNGGAIATGHPLGSSGCRILVSLVHQLQPGQYGVAAICNGGGGATAMVVQRLDVGGFQS